MRVGLLGDTHGKAFVVTRALERFARLDIGTIIQVGDLGVWPGKQAKGNWDQAERLLVKYAQTMYVAPGNHEDYDQIDSLEPRTDGWLPFREHILLAPRGHRTELGGRSVAWLGGAGSVDRSARVRSDGNANVEYESMGSSRRQKTWWPQEEISDEDVARTVAGGHADIMVCHDAPRPVKTIDDYVASAASGFNAIDVEYAAVSRTRLTEAVKAVQPDLLLHGHWHFPVDDVFKVPFIDHKVHVVGLDRDGYPGSLAVLDTETLDVEIVELGGTFGARSHSGAPASSSR